MTKTDEYAQRLSDFIRLELPDTCGVLAIVQDDADPNCIVVTTGGNSQETATSLRMVARALAGDA